MRVRPAFGRRSVTRSGEPASCHSTPVSAMSLSGPNRGVYSISLPRTRVVSTPSIVLAERLAIDR